jgi:hypothetical protein
MYIKSKKDEAIKLRKEGYSYSLISSKISVAKSTLSGWLKCVPFMHNDTVRESIFENNRRVVTIKRVDKANSIQEAVAYAGSQVGELSDRDIFILGLGIYVGEGSKTANFTRIVNSDPKIIRFSIMWLKTCFGLKNSNFRIRLHIYPDNDQIEVIKYWMKYLRMKRSVFYPVYIDTRTNKKKDRQGVLPYGTAHMTVVSNGEKSLGVLLQRKIIASIDFALNQSTRD